MPLGTPTPKDRDFMRLAFEEARAGFDEGGVPVGALMVENGEVVARGRNRRVQDENPVSHGETDCMKNAGRRSDYSKATMYTTLSPCMMCTGAILQFGIRRVVIGEAKNFAGNIEFLSERGVEVATGINHHGDFYEIDPEKLHQSSRATSAPSAIAMSTPRGDTLSPARITCRPAWRRVSASPSQASAASDTTTRSSPDTVDLLPV